MELIIEGGLLEKELVEPLLKEADELVAIMVDDFVKSRESLENVIPAKAGIQ